MTLYYKSTCSNLLVHTMSSSSCLFVYYPWKGFHSQLSQPPQQQTQQRHSRSQQQQTVQQKRRELLSKSNQARASDSQWIPSQPSTEDYGMQELNQGKSSKNTYGTSLPFTMEPIQQEPLVNKEPEVAVQGRVPSPLVASTETNIPVQSQG